MASWTTATGKWPYRPLGYSGLKVSNVGLGTWKFGYPHKQDGSRVDPKTAFAIFDRALELGVTFWDTANRYNQGSGNSERVIGQWFAAHPSSRRNVVLATKMAGEMDGTTPNHAGLSRINILESVYASLERLKTDSIDLLYFHNAGDPDTPPEESLEAIEDLVRQDLVRYFALSNYTAEQLERMVQLSEGISRRCRPIAVQNQFDILSGESAKYPGVFSWCADHGVSFVAWSLWPADCSPDGTTSLSWQGRETAWWTREGWKGFPPGSLKRSGSCPGWQRSWTSPWHSWFCPICSPCREVVR